MKNKKNRLCLFSVKVEQRMRRRRLRYNFEFALSWFLVIAEHFDPLHICVNTHLTAVLSGV